MCVCMSVFLSGEGLQGGGERDGLGYWLGRPGLDPRRVYQGTRKDGWSITKKQEKDKRYLQTQISVSYSKAHADGWTAWACTDMDLGTDIDMVDTMDTIRSARMHACRDDRIG